MVAGGAIVADSDGLGSYLWLGSSWKNAVDVREGRGGRIRAQLRIVIQIATRCICSKFNCRTVS